MAKYIKGKDGKFTGSIGDGKHNIPSAAAAVPGSRLADKPAEQTVDLSSVYAAFQANAQQKPQGVPAVQGIDEGWGESDLGEVYYLDTADYAARVTPPGTYDNDSWEATLAFAHREYDEDGFETGSISNVFQERDFDNKDEAAAWVKGHALASYQVRSDFAARYAANPNFADDTPFDEEGWADSKYRIVNGETVVLIDTANDPYTVSASDAGQQSHYFETHDGDEAVAFARYVASLPQK